MSNANLPFSRIGQNMFGQSGDRLDIAWQFFSLGDECVSRGLVTLGMAVLLLTFLIASRN